MASPPHCDDPLVYKARLIEGTPPSPPLDEIQSNILPEILSSPDLYSVLGATPTSTPIALRRHYLDRSKIVHPDRHPAHPLSTPAFQRLSHAYDILRKPSLRAHYDREARSPRYSGGVEATFRSAVLSILQEFLHGDFQLVRRLLGALGRQYPNLVNDEVVTSLEGSFARMRELVLTTQTYALLLSIELGRLHRVQKRLMGLGYFDVVGRIRVGMQLVRVTLAIPVRVDRALRRKEEREWRARQAGWECRGVTEEQKEEKRRLHQERVNNGGRLLNERVCKVLEFIVGSEVEDMPEDVGVRWENGQHQEAAPASA